MRILLAHNRYQQLGGEDAVVDAESQLLRENGQEVYLHERSNSEIENCSTLEKVKFLFSLNWSRKSYHKIRKCLREFRPDLVHFHNIFYVMTPSVYDACRDEGVPVVQSQHNFRLLCPNALFLRDNAICEDCINKSLWEGVRHRCFRNSRLMSAFLAQMLYTQKKRKTWQNKIDQFIMESDFTRDKYVMAGFPKERISIKYNFEFLKPLRNRVDQGYVLYIGRLSSEKGVHTLLKAWKSILDVPLKIAGDGPQASFLKDYASRHNLNHVEFLGYISEETRQAYLRGAKFLVVPSVCYETGPKTITEAYVCGIPVLASRLGSMQGTIQEGKTGFLFEPGNPDDLAQKALWMLNHPEELKKMDSGARNEFEKNSTPQQNFRILMGIYEKTLEHKHSKQ